MSDSNVTVIILKSNASRSLPVYYELMEMTKESEELMFDIVEVETGEQAVAKLKEKINGILLFALFQKEDVLHLNKFVSVYSKAIKKRFVRFIGANYIKSPQVMKFLKKGDCHEIIDDKLNVKGLIRKLQIIADLVKKSSFQQFAPGENLGSLCLVPVKKKRAKAVHTPVRVLSLKSDCWIVATQKDLVRFKEGWEIRIVGPGPHAGDWEDIGKDPESNLQRWKWVPKNEHIFTFIKDNGSWILVGQEKPPTFDWKTGKWLFTGSDVSLMFFNEKPLAYRFRAQGIECTFSKNSAVALDRKPLFETSADPGFTDKEFEKAAPAPASQEEEVVTEEESPDVAESQKTVEEKPPEEESVPVQEVEEVIEEPAPPTSQSFEGRKEEFGGVTIDFSSVQMDIQLKIEKESEDGEQVMLSDVVDDMIVVKVFDNPFEMEQTVYLTVNCNYSNEQIRFEKQGTVIEILEREDESYVVTVQLDEVDPQELERLIELYMKRQENIENFFQITKG